MGRDLGTPGTGTRVPGYPNQGTFMDSNTVIRACRIPGYRLLDKMVIQTVILIVVTAINTDTFFARTRVPGYCTKKMGWPTRWVRTASSNGRVDGYPSQPREQHSRPHYGTTSGRPQGQRAVRHRAPSWLLDRNCSPVFV